MKLNQKFFEEDALTLAPKLLGKLLCRKIDGQVIKEKIVEVEAYLGQEDTASHAHIGKTERTKTMWGKGGTIYVYLTYGMHFMFNIVSGKEGNPQAILIRGVEHAKGPGKLTKLLKIDKTFNQKNVATCQELWLEDAPPVEKFEKSKRIGINYASQKDKDALFRFFVE